MFLQGFINDDYNNEDEYSRDRAGAKNKSKFELLRHEFRDKFYAGEEHILILKDRYERGIQEFNTRYLCQLCQRPLTEKSLFPHIASYVHIFRHTKLTFPEEYRRITCIEAIDKRVKAILSLNTLLKRHIIMNEKEPDIYFFNQKTTSDQDREFNDILADIKRRDRLSHLEDERLLLEMNDEQEFEQETILSGLQRMKTESSFLGTFMNDELDGFSVGVKVERTETFRDKPKRSNSCKNAFTAPVVPETHDTRSIKPSTSNQIPHENQMPSTPPQSIKTSPITSPKISVKLEPVSGYDTDEIESINDPYTYFKKIQEKGAYCLDNNIVMSDKFTDIFLREFENLDLSAKHRNQIEELLD